MKAKLLGFVPLLIGLMFAPNIINAAEINVDGDIQTAVDSASAGDTLILEATTYNEDVNVNKALIIKGAGKDSTTINGHFTITADATISDLTILDDGTTQVSGTGYGILVNAKSTVNVENALIKYSKYTDSNYGNSEYFTGIWLAKTADGSTLNVDNVEMYAKYGIWVYGQSNDVTVSNSNITGWAPLDISNGSSAQTLASNNKVVVNNSTLTGVATVTGDSNKYGTIVIGGQDGLDLEINGSTVQNKFSAANVQDLILYGMAYRDSKNVNITINDSKLINNDTDGESAVVNFGTDASQDPSSNNNLTMNNTEVTAANGIEFTTSNNYVTVTVVIGDEEQISIIEKDTLFTKPADPKVEGFTFNGWYTTADYDEEFNFEETISTDTTIYAELIENQDTNDNNNASDNEDALLDDVPKTGEKFSFISWLISLFR